jgi:putative peptidoglycan lipid II flippase
MTGMLNAKRHFLAPALGPVFNNVVVITTLLAYPWVRDSFGLTWAHVVLAVGTTVGVVAQMATCIPPLLKLGFRYFPRIDTAMPAMRKMGRKMVPLVAYVAVNLIGVSLRNSIATRASADAVATLNYAWVFYQLPYGIFAVALATAVFPEISDHANREDWPAYRQQLSSGMRANALLVLPAAAMLIALATPLITLWAVTHGAFKMSDVPITADVLRAWGLGLFSFTSYMFAVRGFYSLQDTQTPATTNTVLTLTVQIGLYALHTLVALGWPGIGLVGIPLADGIFYTVHFLVLIALLRSRVGGLELASFARTVGVVVVASAVGGGLAWELVRLTPGLSAGVAVVVQILMAGTAGLAVTFGLAWLFRVKELETAGRMAGRFLGRLAGRSA